MGWGFKDDERVQANMVTIQDIADASGVSISTVSRALSDSPRISQKTRDLIHKIAKEMGYTPSFAAKNLMAPESNTVGVVFQPQNSGISGNDFVMHEMFGINHELGQKNYLLATATGTNWREVYESVKMMVEAGKVRRFILLYTTKHDPITQLLKEYNARVVVTGEPQWMGETLFVDNDNYQAAYEVTQQLIKKFKLQKPLFVRTTAEWLYEENRERGFLNAMPNAEVLRLSENFAEQKGQLRDYFEIHPDVDGIVATDDKIAFLAQHQAEAHLSSHAKLPTVGFNATEYGQLSGKNFFSVDVQPMLLGAEAVHVLFNDQIHENPDEASQNVIVPYKLPKF